MSGGATHSISSYAPSFNRNQFSNSTSYVQHDNGLNTQHDHALHSLTTHHDNTMSQLHKNNIHINNAHHSTNNATHTIGSLPSFNAHDSKLSNIQSKFTRGTPTRPSWFNSSTHVHQINHGFHHVRHSNLTGFIDTGGYYYSYNPWLAYYIYLYGGVLLFSYYSGVPIFDIAYEFNTDPCRLLTDSGEYDTNIVACDPNMFYFPVQSTYYGPDGLLYADMYYPDL
jgi:hypothetical protein